MGRPQNQLFKVLSEVATQMHVVLDFALKACFRKKLRRSKH